MKVNVVRPPEHFVAHLRDFHVPELYLTHCTFFSFPVFWIKCQNSLSSICFILPFP